jgi:hypothetical protein
VSGRCSYLHTTAKNLRPVSWMQAYIAYNSRLKLLTLQPKEHRVAYSQFTDFETQTYIAYKLRLKLLAAKPDAYHIAKSRTPTTFTPNARLI